MRAVSFLVGGLLMLTGCVTLPVGPSVAVMPAPGKPFEVFVADETVCRQYAAQQADADAGYSATWRLQWRYDMAYQQCMYARGNQVPGFPVVSPPPPPPPPATLPPPR